VLVVDDGELADDLVADMTEVLTSFCARLHGRRGARNRADKVLRCARADIGPASLGRDSGAPGVMQAFRFELDPNNRTRSALSSHCGVARFADNWGAARNLAALVGQLAASGAETQNGRGGEVQADAISRCSPAKRQAGIEQSGRTATASSQGEAARNGYICFKQR
jgi:hypothetical protein